MFRETVTLQLLAFGLFAGCTDLDPSDIAADSEQRLSEPAQPTVTERISTPSDLRGAESKVALPMDFKALVAIAKRFECPEPPESAKLVAGFTGWWGGEVSSDSDPTGFYCPGFVLSEEPGDGVRMLMGFTEMVCEPIQKTKAVQEFTLSDSTEKLGSYLISFGDLSSFETCVQLAMIGRVDLADQLWEKFSQSDYIRGDDTRENIGRWRHEPELLLAFAIYRHYERESLLPKSDWPAILQHLENLRNEFPALISRDQENNYAFARSQLIDDLKLSIESKSPAAGSVEELLLKWSRSSEQIRQLSYFDSDKVNADNPARMIFERGVASIEPLVQLVDDRRLSVHVRPAFMNMEPYRLRVGDLAQSLLGQLAGAHIPLEDNLRTRQPEFWPAWLESVDLSNEAQFLKTAAFDSSTGQTFEVPIRVLERRHHAVFESLAESACDLATSATNAFDFTLAIRDSAMPTQDKSALLVSMHKRLPVMEKRAPLQALATIDKEIATQLLLPMIEAFPADVNEPYWKSESASLTHVIMHLDGVDIWRAYLNAAKTSSVGLRMEMMNPMNYAYIGSKNLEFRLAFLAAFLEDETVRDRSVDEQKYDGPCAAFTFPRISMRNYVTMKLASLLELPNDEPDRFWTPDQWENLRNQVKSRLTDYELPDLNSSQNGH